MGIASRRGVAFCFKARFCSSSRFKKGERGWSAAAELVGDAIEQACSCDIVARSSLMTLSLYLGQTTRPPRIPDCASGCRLLSAPPTYFRVGLRPRGSRRSRDTGRAPRRSRRSWTARLRKWIISQATRCLGWGWWADRLRQQQFGGRAARAHDLHGRRVWCC